MPRTILDCGCVIHDAGRHLCPTCASGGPAPSKPRAISPDILAAIEAAGEVLAVIVANAVMIPDPSMQGSTDCYAVPLDDIAGIGAIVDRLRHALATLRGKGYSA